MPNLITRYWSARDGRADSTPTGLFWMGMNGGFRWWVPKRASRRSTVISSKPSGQETSGMSVIRFQRSA